MNIVKINSNRRYLNRFNGMKMVNIGIKKRHDGWEPLYICRDENGETHNFYYSELEFLDKPNVSNKINCSDCYKIDKNEEKRKARKNIAEAIEKFIETATTDELKKAIHYINTIQQDNEDSIGMSILDYPIAMLRMALKMKNTVG